MLVSSVSVARWRRHRTRNVLVQKAALPQFRLEEMPSLCFELGDAAHRQQAIGESQQCRDIVGQHRYPDAEAQGKHPGNAGEVGTEDRQPAVADIAFEVAGDVAQLAQLAEALFHEYDMRGVGGD